MGENPRIAQIIDATGRMIWTDQLERGTSSIEILLMNFPHKIYYAVKVQLLK